MVAMNKLKSFQKLMRKTATKLDPFNSQWLYPHVFYKALLFLFKGVTGLPKAVALTHYQIINGCRIAANAIGIKKEVSKTKNHLY